MRPRALDRRKTLRTRVSGQGLRSRTREPLEAHWPQIRAVWGATVFGAFATVAEDGSAQLTPIGSVYLHPNEPRGYFHPISAARLQKNLTARENFELLFVDGRVSSRLPAWVRGRFDRLVAVRLRGHAVGPRRPANAEELERWRRRVRAVRWTRGHDLLWKEVRFGQELAFDAYVPVRFGAMRHGAAIGRDS